MVDFYFEPLSAELPSTEYQFPLAGGISLEQQGHTPIIPGSSRHNKPLGYKNPEKSEFMLTEMEIEESTGVINSSALPNKEAPLEVHKESPPGVATNKEGNITQREFSLEAQQAVEHLEQVLKDQNSSHEIIYEVYSKLPSPGVSLLSESTRHLLLQQLSVIECKNRASMLRYISIIEDIKSTNLSLRESEWNSAIAYAGRCFARVQSSEVESAILIWKEMELEAGVQSGTVTFNILFDIATKAGKFILAEMILKEMNDRGLKYNRFSHCGLIYFHGLRGDGAGVRKAYRGLIEAGQIVDTTIMNCVIASLIRAGELPAAEQVYERMKSMLREKTGLISPKSDWQHARQLGRILEKAARNLHDQPTMLQRLQAKQCLAPNLQTFFILIRHHVFQTGELRRVAVLLDEMQRLKIPVHGRIFLNLFKGFAHHGGIKYTLWTAERLEDVWISLLSALDDKIDNVEVMKWMVVWIIRAFEKCAQEKRTLEIWNELSKRWKAKNDDERGAVEHLLRGVLRKKRGDQDL